MMVRARWLLGWGMVLAAPALADPDSAPSSGVPNTPAAVDTVDVADPIEVVAPDLVRAPAQPSYAEGWRWVRRSPGAGQAMAAVTVHPADPSRFMAMDGRGSVWASRDSGRTWTAVYGDDGDDGYGLSIDEDVLLNVEARMSELLGDGGGDDLDAGIELVDGLEDEAASDAQDAMDQAGQELMTDLESDPDFILGRSEDDLERRAMVAYVGDLLFASSADSLLMSRNDGRTWGDVLDVHTYQVVPLRGALVALTDDGARVALDPRAWFDVQDGTEGMALVDGALTVEVLLAATEDGLWATRDGQAWARWGSLRGPVVALATHHNRPDQVWAVTGDGLRRSDDRGLTFEAPVLIGQIDDVAVPLPDRVVVTRPGNVLESLDDGQSWTVASRGLQGLSDGRLAVGAEGGLVMAASDGIWALVRFADAGSGPRRDWVGLQQLVSSSLARTGVRRSFDPFKRRYVAALVPTLTVDASTRPTAGLGWASLQGTDAYRQRYWSVIARFRWTPRSTRSTSLQDLDQEPNLDANVIVVGNEALLLTGTDDYVVAARLDRLAVDYQAEVVSILADLYRARTELTVERARLRDADLQRQVLHELAISEIEARLDALTDGAVLRWETEQAIDAKEL